MELDITNNASDKDEKYESQVKDFFSLLKPRVMSLVVFTGFVGILLAPGTIHPFIAFIATLCIALASGAAGAINMWYEVDLDSKMERTKKRPIVMGKVDKKSALEFAIITAFASVFIMAMAVNYLSAFLLLCAILYYVIIYTFWLKRKTPQNIVIGGGAGSFPPLIGWSAVTGNVSMDAIILFLIIFLWTPPHFWALSLYKSDDYQKANIPMLPVVKGNDETRKQILLYSMALFAISIFPFYTGLSGYIYLIGSILLGLRFNYIAIKLYNKYSEDLARKLFRFSLIYLSAIFTLLVIDKMV